MARRRRRFVVLRFVFHGDRPRRRGNVLVVAHAFQDGAHFLKFAFERFRPVLGVGQFRLAVRPPFGCLVQAGLEGVDFGLQRGAVAEIVLLGELGGQKLLAILHPVAGETRLVALGGEHHVIAVMAKRTEIVVPAILQKHRQLETRAGIAGTGLDRFFETSSRRVDASGGVVRHGGLVEAVGALRAHAIAFDAVACA